LEIKPDIEAFFRTLIIWNTKKGARIVSLNQEVPLNPFSIDNIIVKITTQKNKVFKIKGKPKCAYIRG